MPTGNDIIIRKPSRQEEAAFRKWPVWESKPSIFDWVYTQQETCFLLHGKVTVSDDTGSVDFSAGDMVILPSYLACTWHIREPVSKHYSFG